MAEALKSCPFCRGDKVNVVNHGFSEYDGIGKGGKLRKVVKFESYALCYTCKAKGPICDTREEAAAKWNDREEVQWNDY